MNIIVAEIKTKLRFIRNWLVVMTFYFFELFPINNKKIVISNYMGKGYGDNAKYIVEEIIRQQLGCDIVWLCLDRCDHMPNGVRKVKYNSIKAIMEMATAKIWIDNCRKPSYVRKRKDQFYIQTWHGGIALKKIEKDVESKLSTSYIQNAKHDSSMADLFIANSDFCTKMYCSAFWYNGEILKCGYPRNDILINQPPQIKEKVTRHFGLDNDTRIVLYAPTFRVDYNLRVYCLDYDRVLNELKTKYEGDWVFLVRLHPNISNKAGVISYSKNVINASAYDDMQELMLAADMLITDYSSTMFEFMLMQKPVFLYATDIADYKKDRDFYFNIFELPFPVAENNEKLIDLICSFDETRYKNSVTLFSQEVDLFEKGNAAVKIVNKIKEVI